MGSRIDFAGFHRVARAGPGDRFFPGRMNFKSQCLRDGCDASRLELPEIAIHGCEQAKQVGATDLRSTLTRLCWQTG